MRIKCEKVPTPEDPLDRWYANLIDIHGYNLIAAVLPDYRFCAIVWDVPVDPSTDLTQLLVPAIRSALRDPHYGIPQSLVDRYMPEDTRFELCATGDSKCINGMGAATKDLQDSAESYFSYIEGLDVAKAQRRVNTYLEPHKPGEGKLLYRWEAVKEQLLQRYGEGVPAMELEVSLDLREYVARRTLIVPEEITFDVLHRYLKAAFYWEHYVIHQFILPPVEDRHAPLHIFGPLAHIDALPEGDHYLWGEDVRLSEQLQEGDRFQYLYHSQYSDKPWTVDILVRRCIPSYKADLPVCTFCEGKAPPERVKDVDGYLAFRKALSNPQDPKRREYILWAGLEWFFPDSPDQITRWIHATGYEQ